MAVRGKYLFVRKILENLDKDQNSAGFVLILYTYKIFM